MNILFMCVANSARSQLAEGLARHIFPEDQIQSAGSKPGKLNPIAVKVMRELSIDISSHYSKSIDDLPPEFLRNLDYVIALCAEEVCPVLISNAKKLHWPLPDPASQETVPEAESLRRFREARDSLRTKLFAFEREVRK